MESRSRDICDEGSRPDARTPNLPWGLAPASAELVHPGSRDPVDLISEDAIAIVDDEVTGMAARQRFPELLQRPFRRRMGSDVLVENLAGPDLYDDEDAEGSSFHAPPLRIAEQIPFRSHGACVWEDARRVWVRARAVQAIPFRISEIGIIGTCQSSILTG
jgi:hypothetical protein